MNQITIRGIPADVERAIRAESAASQLSLNKTIINMLKRASNAIDARKTKAIGQSHAFDGVFNTWTKKEADDFDAIIEEAFERIDEEMWK
jgi:hypothetical protein